MKQIVSYNDTFLISSEADVLTELEYQIGKVIPQVPEIERNTFGFTAENKFIKGLGLYNQGLKSLP
ncbi:MAG: hypothetical protein ACFFDI_01855, partial [Promethearchaeota archaeon]